MHDKTDAPHKMKRWKRQGRCHHHHCGGYHQTKTLKSHLLWRRDRDEELQWLQVTIQVAVQL